ncbi:tetratricopeptide repeat protein [Kutzneria buriramensis]|uniref:tetratricopeptide repeat protein n=1 Tax=Kutzneria buriramensis TaxID=1045776 RepID=UPI0014770322|nr:tetratricopeptide repeat protein [Kutzneria buriramensis]
MFSSRKRELAALEKWRSRGPTTIVISGAAGVGKTSLALRWLHDVREHFPGGQLYAHLGAHSIDGPAAPEDVLEWFLRAFGVPADSIPASAGQREAMYRSVTADGSVAVLLDDAVSAAQIRPLLPASPHTVVVVTSQWRLAGLRMDGARFLEIGPLNVADSIDLLDSVAGNGRLAEEPEHAEELVQLCGGLPIALSVVGARLASRPNRSLSREVSALRGSDRLATLSLEDDCSVEAVFDVSYRGLPHVQAQLYRLCALHPGPAFGIEVAGAAAHRPAREIEPSLDALVDRNLLNEVGDGRYRYHDLLLVHGRQMAEAEDPPEVRDAARRRMIEWYLTMAIAADLVLRPTRRRVGPHFREALDAPSTVFDTERMALRWLEVERRNLVSAVHAAAELGWDQVVWELCEALWAFYLNFRPYGDWLAIHRLGIPAAQRVGHRTAEARLRIQLASALANLERHDEAIEENRRAVRLAELEHDEATKAAALSELADSAQGQGDLAGALSHLHQAKQIRERIGTPRAVAVGQRRIGEVLLDLGRTEEAVAEFRHAADALATLDRAQCARALTGLARAYARNGRLADARRELDEVLEITSQLGLVRYAAEAVVVLAEVAELAGDLRAARTHYLRARAVFAEQEDPKADRLAERIARLPET